MIDLTPTSDRVRAIVAGLPEDRLDDPTPVAMTVAEVVDHLASLSVAFRDAAGKLDSATTSAPPQPPSGRLPADWRDRVDAGLTGLAAAWSDEEAWTGTTRAGGVEMPGEICGLVALDEVLLHGWDLAVATGQRYEPTDGEAEAVLPIVTPEAGDGSDREGLFGPVVEVPGDAPLFDRVLGLAGRDPGWSPA